MVCIWVGCYKEEDTGASLAALHVQQGPQTVATLSLNHKLECLLQEREYANVNWGGWT